MNEIRAKILVDSDHHVSGVVPDNVPPGEHEVTITVAPTPKVQPASEPFSFEDWPTVDLGPWPEGLSLRREDIYDDDGR